MSEKILYTEDFNYNLPDEKIAKFPLKNRDSSKLLIYNNKNIEESKFNKLPDFLPSKSLLVFNNTKVINARLIFRKETGAKIEIFCLNPFSPNDYTEVFNRKQSCSWVCMVGNLRKWKDSDVKIDLEIEGVKYNVFATKSKIQNEDGIVVDFNWDVDLTFGEILEIIGTLPIPPYLNRDTEDSDKETYQTVYSKDEGSVAAPTAGLHFTTKVLEDIKQKGVALQEVTLHVGAGTFKPINSSEVSDHPMHKEYFIVTKECIQNLVDHQNNIIAVGTTSLRTLESIYWIGAKIIEKKITSLDHIIILNQWENTTLKEVPLEESLNAILNYLDINKLNKFEAETQIMIMPGYKFKVITALLTNFHQPKSTLLLLISAIMGDFWKKFYNYALENNFRFLSYGDSSLILIEK